MIETLPTEIHGASVTVGSARRLVDDPIGYVRSDELDAEITASRTQAACTLPGGGHFWVEDGKRVIVEAGEDDRPTPWLHATVAAIVLAQQGRFALHANVVDVNGMVTAFCGQRGAGKSTTSLALSQRGHRLITDDVTTLDVEPTRVVHPPAGRPVHVHPETAERLGVSLEGAVPVVGDPTKVQLENPATPPVALNAIVLLRAAQRDNVEVVPLSTAEGMQAIHFHTYRRSMLEDVWNGDMFRWAAGVAGHVPVYLLVRPAGEWTTDAVCEAVEAIAAGAHR